MKIAKVCTHLSKNCRDFREEWVYRTVYVSAKDLKNGEIIIFDNRVWLCIATKIVAVLDRQQIMLTLLDDVGGRHMLPYEVLARLLVVRNFVTSSL